jgi:hypothetical protein
MKAYETESQNFDVRVPIPAAFLRTDRPRGDEWCRMVKKGEFQKKTVTSRLCTIRHHSSPFITIHHHAPHIASHLFTFSPRPLSPAVCTNVQESENEKNANHALPCTFLHTYAHSCTF